MLFRSIISDEVKLAKESGINSIIEVTNIGMGRDVNKLKTISKESGVNIIASTGFYTTKFYPEYIYTKSLFKLAKQILKEIDRGIDGTDIKAGVIGEIGTTNTFTEEAKKVFDAAIIAHNESNVPIFTHCQVGMLGLEQVEHFIYRKMDLDKVVIGHMDLNTNFQELTEILKSGVNIAFDTIGKKSYVPNENKADFLKKLIDLGYEDHVLLSQDITRMSYLKKMGGIGYVEVMDKFIPMLRERNIDEKVIKKLMETNVARILDI